MPPALSSPAQADSSRRMKPFSRSPRGIVDVANGSFSSRHTNAVQREAGGGESVNASTRPRPEDREKCGDVHVHGGRDIASTRAATRRSRKSTKKTKAKSKPVNLQRCRDLPGGRGNYARSRFRLCVQTLQRGRDPEVAEMKMVRRSRADRCRFNEAATRRSRKSPALPVCGASGASGFNEAATRRSRKSMPVRAVHSNPTCFNEAAPGGRGNCRFQTPMARRDSLQRGRDPEVAEMRGGS
jgi:hypothetical protein